MKNALKSNENRIVFLDYLRVFVCYLVILVHACEYYYLGDSLTEANIFWANVIDSGLRACVPIFVMLSSYLLLPLKDEVEPFFKKRLTRVLIPFLIWSVAYATLPLLWGAMDLTESVNQLIHLSYNFNLSAGHLWYVYMFIGIYLFMPILSPWLKTVKKKHEEWFLIIWFLSTFHHYLKYLSGDEFGILGECAWNEFTPFFYFSGFIGYVVLAHYIRTYIHWSMAKSFAIGVPLYLIGWGVSYLMFDYFFPTNDPYLFEMGWRFCTPNTVFTTIGIFVIFKSIKATKAPAIITDISKLSYGIYLAHIFVLNVMYKFFNQIESTPIKIYLIAASTFVLTYLLIKLLSYLPKSKYIVG
ncbi:MAG: acyltransferase [Phocaeicola sp.]